jgi:hypothetical protein
MSAKGVAAISPLISPSSEDAELLAEKSLETKVGGLISKSQTSVRGL